MTKDELKELIATTLVGQGNQVDIGNNLSDILKETISLATPSGAEELNALVDSVIGGQGNQIDVGGALGAILNALADSVTFSGDMTKEEVVALINDAIVGQGNQIDASGKLPLILTEIVDGISDYVPPMWGFIVGSNYAANIYLRYPAADEGGYYAWVRNDKNMPTQTLRFTETEEPEVGYNVWKKDANTGEIVLDTSSTKLIIIQCYGNTENEGAASVTNQTPSGNKLVGFRDSRMDIPSQGYYLWKSDPSGGNYGYFYCKSPSPQVGDPTYEPRAASKGWIEAGHVI